MNEPGHLGTWQSMLGLGGGGVLNEEPHPEYLAYVVIFASLLAIVLYGIKYDRVMGYYHNMWDKHENPFMYWSTLSSYVFALFVMVALLLFVTLER